MSQKQGPGKPPPPTEALAPQPDAASAAEDAATTETIPELHGFPASLDTKEVASVLGILAPEVSTRLAAGEWPGFRIGVVWRMRRSVLQRLMLGKDPWADTKALEPPPPADGQTADDLIPELRSYPASLSTREVAEVLNIVNQAEVSSRLTTSQWPGFRVGVQWRMRRSVVQLIMLGKDPWQGQPPRRNQPRNRRQHRQTPTDA